MILDVTVDIVFYKRELIANSLVILNVSTNYLSSLAIKIETTNWLSVYFRISIVAN